MDPKAMFRLTYGLFVLTAKTDEKDNGCIINTAMQVTNTPNRISIAVNKTDYTHDMVLNTGLFNVSVISEEAKFELFKHFGFQSGRDVDKFASYTDIWQYRDWETDRKSTRLNSSHSAKSRMPSSA